MDKLEKVIKGLEICATWTTACDKCPFNDKCKGASNAAMAAAIELLKAQNEVIQALCKVGYPHNFQREEPWIVNYMNAITDVIKKAVRLNNG